MKKEFFKIAKDFSITPGPRKIIEGPNSAEFLLDTMLYSLFEKIIDNDAILVIDLDDTKGYATSFLEGTFGGLARKFTPDIVLKHLEIKSEKKMFYKEESLQYIKDVRQETIR